MAQPSHTSAQLSLGLIYRALYSSPRGQPTLPNVQCLKWFTPFTRNLLNFHRLDSAARTTRIVISVISTTKGTTCSVN